MTIFACDTETTVSIDNPQVYLLGGIEVCPRPRSSGCFITRTVREFLEWCFTKDNNDIFFFHNLKFDYSYIYHHLVTDPYYTNYIQIEKELIVGMTKKVMRVSLTKKNKTIHLQDSFIRFYQPLASIAKTYNKLWTMKLSIDHTYPEAPDKVSPKMLKYFKYDLCTLAEALSIRSEMGEGKLTTGSDAKAMIKADINRRYSARLGSKAFSRVFPSLNRRLDKYLRKFYSGGFVYANPAHTDKVLSDVDTYDINSMYPAIMRDKPMPIGLPEIKRTIPPAGLFLCEIEVEYAYLKEGRIPWLSNGLITSYGSKAYSPEITPSESKEFRTLYLTNMEWELLNETYDVGTVKVNNVLVFRSSTKMFSSFVDQMMKIKETSVGALRDMAKRFANTPSGKWGENPENSSYKSVLRDGIQCFEEQPPEKNRQAFYLPVSIFTTAYGRCQIIRAANSVGRSFVYCDTDSIHALSLSEGKVMRRRLFDIHPTRMGAFKHESNGREKVLRAKRYCKELPYNFPVKGGFKALSKYWDRTSDVITEIVCAGISKKDATDITVESFCAGKKITCLRGRQRVGGIALVPTSIEI